jgi:biopolymer transport protein TolR
MQIIVSRKNRKIFNEINVTPFVDVMLVLLVIFMVTAPMLDQGIQINLPKTKAGKLEDAQKPITLYLKSDKSLLIDSYDVKENNLITRLKYLYKPRIDKDIFIKADESLPYGFVAKILSDIKEAGINKIGLVTATPEQIAQDLTPSETVNEPKQ